MAPRVPGPCLIFGGNVWAVAFLAQSDWVGRATAGATVIALVGTAAATLLWKLGNMHLEMSKKFKALEVEHEKALDAARKEMIGPKLEESIRNQELMRESLGEIRDELHSAKLENRILRDDLEQANKQVAETNGLFMEASRQVARLTGDLGRFRRDQPEAVRSAVREAIGDSQVGMPVHEEPPG